MDTDEIYNVVNNTLIRNYLVVQCYKRQQKNILEWWMWTRLQTKEKGSLRDRH